MWNMVLITNLRIQSTFPSYKLFLSEKKKKHTSVKDSCVKSPCLLNLYNDWLIKSPLIKKRVNIVRRLRAELSWTILTSLSIYEYSPP